MKTVPIVRLADTADAVMLPELAEEIALAMCDIAGAAREGLLAMSVAAGMAVMQAMFDTEITAIAGPKGKHDPDRVAVRHGSEKGSVTLGGRRIPVSRPRARTTDGHEVAVGQLHHFASDDLLTQVVMERMAAGVATRRHARVGEPVGAVVESEAKSTSRSAIRTPDPDCAGRTDDPRPVRRRHHGSCCSTASTWPGGAWWWHWRSAITADGTKKPVGLSDGSTENKTVVRSLLADLVERGLRFDDGLLVVIDGAKALSAAVAEVFGDKAAVQRCTLHKRRSVAQHLPGKDQAWVDAKLVKAFNHPDPRQGLANAKHLAAQLDKNHPGAAASLREGL